MIDFKTENKEMRPVGRIAFVVTMALTALFWAGLGQAQEEAPGLRVVNLDSFPKDISPDEGGIEIMAGLDTSEHSRLFADCCALNVATGIDVRCYEPDMVIGMDASLLTVSIGEGTPLNFTTARTEDGAKRCDAAVVDSEGVVTCLDRPVVIDYALRNVSFVDMSPLKPGDTLILFVEDASPFAGRQENTGKNYDCG